MEDQLVRELRLDVFASRAGNELCRTQTEVALRESGAKLKQRVRLPEVLLHISQAVQEMTQPSDLEKVMLVCLQKLRQTVSVGDTKMREASAGEMIHAL